MSDKEILLSAYRCDPEGVSEAYSGFRCAVTLAQTHRVTLATPSFNAERLTVWLEQATDRAVRQNMTIFPIPMPDVDSRLGLVGSALKPGFFLYESRLLRSLRVQRIDSGWDAVWHRTPVSFRFRTRLHRLGRPLIVGPISGGLHPPIEMAGYFRDEGLLYRLRALDGMLLRSRFWMRPLERASSVLVSSDYLREILPKWLEPKIVTLIETGVDAVSSRAPLTDMTSPSRVEGDGFHVLFVGRMVRYKGPVLAVRAFARFLELADDVSAHMTLIGDGPEMADIVRTVESLGISRQVTLTGRLSRAEAVSAYETADVFLFPSVTEAAGNVYLEAMNAGLPMVVVRHGGGADVPCDAASVKVPVSDIQTMVESLAHALHELWADPDRRRTMGEAGKICVSRRYTWAAIGHQMETVVQSVTGGTE